MHLIYLDESGNSGTRLDDPSQPVLVLAALMVPAKSWQSLEGDLSFSLRRWWPDPPEGFEIHASELINPSRAEVRALKPAERMAFALDWLSVAKRHHLQVLYRSVDKARFHRWQVEKLGQGVRLHPQVAAFALLARSVDTHLAALPGRPLGMLIFDDNKQVARDIDKSLGLLLATDSPLRLSRIIERGFFVDSRRSLPLQLCDLCVYFLRRRILVSCGATLRPFEGEIFSLLSQIAPDKGEHDCEVLTWLETLPKKMRPGA